MPSAPAEMLVELDAASAVLAAVIRAAEPRARTFYGSDRTDRSGIAAVACDELLIHAWDIGRAFGQQFTPAQTPAQQLIARLFPWAPEGADPWRVLLWSNGRIALADRPRLGPGWLRWLAPIEEWNGADPNQRVSGR